jgi:hypothetical protein
VCDLAGSAPADRGMAQFGESSAARLANERVATAFNIFTE